MRRLDVLADLDDLFKLEKQNEENWVDRSYNGVCSNCGSCCGNLLPLSDEEIKTIHRYMKHHRVRAQVCRYPTAFPIIDATCPFRSNTEKRCLIYAVRPAICREFHCSKPKEQIFAERDLHNAQKDICNMREEFFGR